MENGVKNEATVSMDFIEDKKNKEKIYRSEKERFIQSECYEKLSLIILI